MKLIALYAKPDDVEAFNTAYFDTHVPLIEKVPGLQSMHVSKHVRTITSGKAPFMITEMRFADKESLVAALNSPEMAAAGENLDSFTKGRYTLMMAE